MIGSVDMGRQGKAGVRLPDKETYQGMGWRWRLEGMGKDYLGMAVVTEDTLGRLVDTPGCLVESPGCPAGTPGCPVDTPGCPVDTPGCSVDTLGFLEDIQEGCLGDILGFEEGSQDSLEVLLGR